MDYSTALTTSSSKYDQSLCHIIGYLIVKKIDNGFVKEEFDHYQRRNHWTSILSCTAALYLSISSPSLTNIWERNTSNLRPGSQARFQSWLAIELLAGDHAYIATTRQILNGLLTTYRGKHRIPQKLIIRCNLGAYLLNIAMVIDRDTFITVTSENNNPQRKFQGCLSPNSAVQWLN